MKPENASKLGDDKECGISILAVVTPNHSSEVDRILSHTRWRTHVVSSFHEAAQALRTLPISVVLCEDRLPDGKWLDVMQETERLNPRPQTIVLSRCADASLWGEVLNCGGYDLLALPLEPKEVYAVIPMAWRHYVSTAQSNPPRDCERNFPCELAEVSQ